MAFPMVVLSIQENCIVAIIKLTARKKEKNQLPLPSHIIIVQNERHYKTSRQTKAEKRASTHKCGSIKTCSMENWLNEFFLASISCNWHFRILNSKKKQNQID